jgi:hypothetical protein
MTSTEIKAAGLRPNKFFLQFGGGNNDDEDCGCE